MANDAETVDFYDKIKVLTRNIPNEIAFDTPEYLQKHVYQWAKDMKKGYITILGMIEMLPEKDLTEDKLKQLIQQMNNFFAQMSTLAFTEEQANQLERGAKINPKLQEQVQNFRNDPGVQEIKKLSKECSNLFDYKTVNDYVKEKFKTQDSIETIRERSKTLAYKYKHQRQLRKKKNPEDMDYMGAACVCLAFSFCLVTIPLAVYFIRKDREERKMLGETHVIKKEIEKLDLISSAANQFKPHHVLKKTEDLTKATQNLKEVAASVRTKLAPEMEKRGIGIKGKK